MLYRLDDGIPEVVIQLFSHQGDRCRDRSNTIVVNELGFCAINVVATILTVALKQNVRTDQVSHDRANFSRIVLTIATLYLVREERVMQVVI